jgi:8-oxo-dGTP pyrophosphatase MutT (NUDIX family)
MTEEHECSFDDDPRWFRVRAAAIIVHEGKVLMARNSAEPFHYSVGGGVHHYESAEQAVRREVREELGIDLAVDRLAFIHENFFDGDTTSTLAGRRCHELGFYFLMHFDPTKDQVKLTGNSTTAGVPEHFEWVDLATYGRDRVAYPAFLASELASLGPAPKLITTWD